MNPFTACLFVFVFILLLYFGFHFLLRFVFYCTICPPLLPHIRFSFVQFPEHSKPCLMHANYELFPLTLGIRMEERKSLASKLVSLLLPVGFIIVSRVKVSFPLHSMHSVLSFNSSPKPILKPHICIHCNGVHLCFPFFALFIPYPPFVLLTVCWQYQNHMCI